MDVDSYLGSFCYNDVEEDEEEYIDMEVSSYTNPFCHLNSSEFEFQMFSSSSDREFVTTSPADELFYKGNLLPLHLPPRLQMVEKILQNNDTFDDFFSTPLATSPYATPLSNTPFRSCNISPSGSYQVSRELNPEDYFLDNITTENPKKSWTKKLNLTKLKASRDYLKSFFGKSGCSDGTRSKFPRTSGKKKQKLDGNNNGHGRLLSTGAMMMSKRFSTTTNTSSNNANGSSDELQVHHRSINMSLETDNQIQSAIAHCKRSQQQLHSISDMGFC